jgi:hypothetical protein
LWRHPQSKRPWRKLLLLHPNNASDMIQISIFQKIFIAADKAAPVDV